MNLFITKFLLVLLSVRYGSSCGSGGGTGDTKLGVLQRLVGKEVTASPYDGSSYSNSNGGPVGQGSDLNCDFSTSCCWKNADDNSGLTWQTATGPPETAKMNRNFGTTTVPDGNWLVVPSEQATGAAEQAKFQSCSFECTTTPIKVTMRHWATKGVTIKVCTQADGSTTLQNCQNLPTKNPGPDTVTLPAVTSRSSLVIVASGFTASIGSVAMIDDLKVDFTVCPTTTTSTTTESTTTSTTTQAVTTASAVVCTKVQCNFESNSACSYTDASTTNLGGANKKWQIVSGQFDNKATGIYGAGEGTYYMATSLKPTDAAALVTNVNFDQDRVVRFLAYKALQGADLQACCDKVENCVYKLGTGVQTSDFRAWKTISIICPAGTKQVIFYAKNTGQNLGAVGLDNIQVLVPSGSDPNAATQTAC